MLGIVPNRIFTHAVAQPGPATTQADRIRPRQHSSPGSFAFAWSALSGHHLPVISRERADFCVTERSG
jgi:hypothetical protein